MARHARSASARLTRPLLALAVLGTVACSGRTFTVPPITAPASAEQHVGKWVWYDLLTHDADAAERFYGELFGWEFAAPSDGTGPFTAISHRGQAIGGMFRIDELEGSVSRARWVPYVSVADVDAAVRLARGVGGAVYRDALDLPDRGRMAVLGDPQGAVFGVVQSSSGDPGDVTPPAGRFFWTELWTRDVDAAVDFYYTLAGYTHTVLAFPGGTDYDVLQAEGRPRAGVVALPFEDVLPNWLPYVLVDDPQAVVARVAELGGRVLVPPHADIRNGSVALIADPSGAALTIQKWPIDGDAARGFPQ